MKFYNITLLICFMFFNCASQQEQYSFYKTLESNPKELEMIYYQSWVAGVQGGGSGLNIYIKDVLIEHPIQIYFRNTFAKLEHKNGYYIARFKSDINQYNYVIMSDNPKQEYTNKLPEKITFPFDLKDNEAVILVLKDGKNAYIKIENIPQKPVVAYPSVKK